MTIETGLRGWRVAITGASGGIGRALVDAFSGEGCALGLVAHRGRAALEAFLAERADPVPVACESADLREPDEVERAFGALSERLGGLDACVLNAGIWPAEAVPLQRMPVDRIRDVIAIDLVGALLCARAFLGVLERQGPRPDGGGSSVLCIGSTAGRFGEPGHAEYAAAKAGLHGLVRTLKTEIVALDPRGRANLLEPGWTATPMAASTLADASVRARALATTPLRRVARPEDVARMAVVLCSPALAGHVSGEVLTVSGGMDGRLVWDPADPG